MAPGAKTAFLVVPSGFAARYLLRTDILPTLRAAGARVVILAPNADEAYLREEFETDGVHVEALRTPPKQEKRSLLWWWVLHLRNYAIGNGHRTPALRGKYASFPKKYLAGQPVEQRVFSGALHLLWRSRTLRRGLLGLELRLYTEPAHADLFERYRPDVVVTTSPGYFKPDARMLREAALHGVPTVTPVLSWDNPTSKGYRGGNPDRVVVWSQRMADQMVRFQDFRRDQIVVGGVPHFDAYHRDGALPGREDLDATFGLDPSRRLIVFATSSPGYYDRDAEVAEVLARAIADDALPEPSQLVVRLHPNFPAKDVSMADFERLAAEHEHVHLDIPEILSKKLSCDMPRSDGARLGALIKNCDVLVNVLSTTTLEAFATDRPVVLIDSKGTVYYHLQLVLRSGAAPVAHTPQEIVAHVGRYLEHPEHERALRAEVVRRELGPSDGNAGRRIAEVVLEAMALDPPARADRDVAASPATV